jgi:hypothetical protein
MYDGAIHAELVGDEITEHALVGSALNIDSAQSDTAFASRAQ